MNDNGNFTLDDVKLDNDEMTFDAWHEKYQPITNGITKYPSGNDYDMFETYGAELDFVSATDPHYVWTEVQADMCMLLVPGLAFINRLGYYVTRIPWTNQDEVVVLSMDIECHCYDESDGEGDPSCDDCEGYGLRTVSPDDPEVILYHEENA